MKANHVIRKTHPFQIDSLVWMALHRNVYHTNSAFSCIWIKISWTNANITKKKKKFQWNWFVVCVDGLNGNVHRIKVKYLVGWLLLFSIWIQLKMCDVCGYGSTVYLWWKLTDFCQSNNKIKPTHKSIIQYPLETGKC